MIEVQVPSLRERIDDLDELATAVLQRIAAEEGNDRVTLDDSAVVALRKYHFPGNVRELENMLERALAMSDGETITADDLQFSSHAPRAPAPEEPSPSTGTVGNNRWAAQDAYGDLEAYLDDIERQILSTALEESRWNKTATAKLLGISFRSLRYRLKKLGLEE